MRRAPAAVLLLAVAALVAALVACRGGESADRPNIVLIIGDDVGWSDFGFMGARDVRTPNLDRLAAEGAVFTHAMSSASTCKPALRTLLTGLEQGEVLERLGAAGRGRLEPPVFSDVFETLPERLAERGYASFQGGKFWEGRFEMGGFTHGMTTRYGNDVVEFEGYHRHSGADALVIGRETMEPLFAFLEQARGRPFFVWYAPLLPHLPHDAPEEFRALYADDPSPKWVRDYRANLTWFDATVGALIAKLDELALRESTLIVYVSDNGWDASLEKSRRGKGSMYEQGFRTPLILARRGVIPVGRHERLVTFADVFATLVDAAGATPVADSAGRSLLPFLANEGDFYREQVIGGSGSQSEGDWFVRTSTWRYRAEGGRESLYRIEEDPFEERDVADRHPGVVARLRADLRKHLQ